MRNIRGNSMTPCPRAIKAPAVFHLEAFWMVTANSGPGNMTPDRDMSTTEIKNKVKSGINSNLSLQLEEFRQSPPKFFLINFRIQKHQPNILFVVVFLPSMVCILTMSVLFLAAT